MSALCGLIDLDGAPLNGEPARRMLAAQRFYGSGIPRIRRCGNAEFGVDLRQTLLEDRFDCQPLIVANTLLVADVRLDNRQELLHLIGRGGGDAQGLADATILSLAWQRFGVECLPRIHGDFAVAVYCARTNRLVLARDTTGQRPLHYARRGGSIAFASMPSGILALESFWRGFDQQALARVLLDIPQAPSSTSFAEIFRVPAGSAITVGPDDLTRDELWTPDYAELRLPADDYVDAYREVLGKAVRSRMRRASGALAAHLSSGFDSNAVASTAAQALPSGQPLIALTAAPPIGFSRVSPRGRIADESALADLTAGRHGMRHVIVRTAKPMAERLRAQARLYQDPYRNLINAGWLMSLEEAAAEQGASVLLAADLGNLTLNCGGIRTLADIVERHGLFSWWREALLVARMQDVRWRGILFNSFGHHIPAAIQQRLIEKFLRVAPKRKLSFLRPDIRDQLPALSCEYYGIFHSSSYIERWNYLRTLDYGTIRKASFAETNVETRDPMADRRIIEFSTRLPPDQLLSEGISRPLAKAALADRVPPEVLNATVRGYQAAHWTELLDQYAMRELIEEISGSHAVGEVLDIAKMRGVLDRWPRMRPEDFQAYELFAGHLPQALAVGLFIMEHESRN